MPKEESRAPLDEAGASVLAHLASVYEREGSFGSQCGVAPGWNPGFTFADWLRAFLRIPRMRRDLCLGMLWSSFSRWKAPEGLSHRYLAGRRFNFSHRSFCDLLIFEAMLDAAAHFDPLPLEGAARLASGCMELARRNARRIRWEGMELDLYSYFPSRDHQIDPKSAAWKWFLSLDASVPDNDSTSVVLSCLLGLGGRLGKPDRSGPDGKDNVSGFLRMLASHTDGTGTYGQGSLSYENGAARKVGGIVTWLFDRHNEIDPTSNINILQFLATVRGRERRWPERSLDLAHGILRFLELQVTKPDFLLGRAQQYYPPGSVCYFWYRFERAWDGLPQEAKDELDPGKRVGRVRDALIAAAAQAFQPDRANPGDMLLASPFLVKHGLMDLSHPMDLESAEEWIGHFSAHSYEVFHLLYPVKMICISEKLPLAAYLYALIELDKRRPG